MLAIETSAHTDTKLLRLLLDNLPHSAAALFDENLRIVCAGGELLSLFNLHSDSVGRHIADVVDPLSSMMFTRIFAAAIRGQSFETTWPFGDKLLHYSVFRVRDSSVGSPLGAIVVQDVMRLSNAPTMLAQDEHVAVSLEIAAAQSRARMLDLIVHEFRNPLAAAASSVELLEHYGEKMAPERRNEHLAQIREELHRLSDILDNIITRIS